MKIALLIPVYNAESFLRDCLDSALAAGREVEKLGHTFDIYCCNDGSTDRSHEILKAYADSNTMIHVSEHANRGMVKTNNRLMDELPPAIDAFGFLDSDDYVHPLIYARLVSAMERTGADVAECGIVGVPYESSCPAGFAADLAKTPETTIADMSVFWRRKTSPGRWINKVNKLYRREPIKHLRFREGLNYEDDIFFNMEVHAAVSRKVLVEGAFYAYRKNPASLNGQINARRYFEATTLRIRLTCETFLKKNRVPPEFRSGFVADITKDAFRMCIRKNLKKNKDAVLRKELFLSASRFLMGLERDYGFKPAGLNPIQRAIYMACLSGRYELARLISCLT